MDPRAFVKLSVSALGVRVPLASKPARTGVHSSTSPFFCEVRLPGYPVQTTPVPLVSPTSPPPDRGIAANFYLDESALDKLLSPTSCFKSSFPCLEVLVYTGRQGTRCGVKEGKLMGTFSLPVSSQWMEGKPIQLHSGWTGIGKGNSTDGKPGAELHLVIKVEADPRYIFQFDGETVASPQIVQIQGKITQPLFSCKFSRDRLSRSSGAGKWSGPLGGHDHKERKERKGWLIMIHDLSGSPVAAASMVTPFVPSAGSDRVSRSNPGAWLILRPDSTSGDSWEPWGRLEAWKERGSKGGLGLRFQLVAENGGGGTANVGGALVSETVISSHSGGEFSIDTARFRPATPSPARTPVQSPRSSGDCNFINVGLPASGGFVMSCTTRGERQSSSGRPLVQLAMRHITCAEDAAVFMALAAAVDLSIDACQPFSRKLRKELS
ncbi:hypothetical protein SELMODRAFT_77561 [Selaginella moellendorffii]|uniref:Formin-like protein 18 n=1 Tax=Selaginella moellendorffii TaxID=88036 RepID=D8QT60_SELML|nr:hypothetical protein SELMODRAFT_77561 [Selaginella moellendorffii]